MFSPAIWTSIATGKIPQKHGIEDFTIKLPGQYEKAFISSGFRKTKAVWNILSEYGKTLVTISWWATRPPETVRGVMVSDGFSSKRETYPDQIKPKIQSLYKQATSQAEQTMRSFTSFIYNPQFANQYELNSLNYFYNQTYSEDVKFSCRDFGSLQATLWLYPKIQPDFLAVCFYWTDYISHSSWRFWEPRSLQANYPITNTEREYFSNMIPQVYELMDQYIGQIVSRLPKETTIIIVSDHGFSALEKDKQGLWMDMNVLLAELGYMTFDQHGEVVWPKTQAYDTKNIYRWEREIYLNIAGREPQGIIPFANYQKEREKLANILSALQTTSGKKVFVSVNLPKTLTHISNQERNPDLTPLKGTSMYTGDISISEDILATFNPELSANDIIMWNKRSIAVKKFLSPRNFTGTHEENGIVIISGNAIRKKEILSGASVLDITPTMLYLMGLPVAKDMDGKILSDAIAPEYWQKHPPNFIETYEDKQKNKPLPVQPTIEDRETMERLRALGYIGK